jgi:hypothetical protein
LIGQLDVVPTTPEALLTDVQLFEQVPRGVVDHSEDVLAHADGGDVIVTADFDGSVQPTGEPIDKGVEKTSKLPYR